MAQEKVLGRIYVDDLMKMLEGIPYTEDHASINLSLLSDVYENKIFFVKSKEHPNEIEELDLYSLNNKVELMEPENITWGNLSLAIQITYTSDEKERDIVIKKLLFNMIRYSELWSKAIPC